MRTQLHYFLALLILGAGFLVWKYRSKFSKSKLFSITIFLLITYSISLTWPQIRGLWKERGALYTEKWMSEQETEEFVVETLRQADVDVFIQRTRVVIAFALRYHFCDRGTARFRCENDTVWQTLSAVKADSVFHIITYDGTDKLSARPGCEIEYLTEQIRTWDWLDYEPRVRGPRPNPSLD